METNIICVCGIRRGNWRFIGILLTTNALLVMMVSGGDQGTNATLFQNRPNSSFQCKSGNHVPGIQRCDLVKDCSDGSDETACTRHPGAGPPIPNEVAEQWVQASIWSRKTNGSSLILRHGRTLFNTCKRYRDGLIFDGTPDENSTKKCADTRRWNNIANMTAERIKWVKSTAGHIPKGAVVVGMSQQFQLSFLCRFPRVYLQNPRFLIRNRQYDENIHERLENYWKPSAGVLNPKNRTCMYLQEGFLDYEVLVNTEDADLQISCGTETFNCTRGNECIHSHFVCDGESDCADGSDEEISQCQTRNSCLENEFPCSDGKCIPMENLCEVSVGWFRTNCFDGSDESKETYEKFCRNDKFQCIQDESFIPINQRCNSQGNCRDFSDEKNCTRYPFLKQVLPHQLEDRNFKKGFWVNSEASFQEYFLLASVTETFHPKHKFEHSYFRRAEQWLGVFRLQCSENCLYFVKTTKNETWTAPSDTHYYEVLQHASKSEWVKSAKGYVPDGAVIMGLTDEYEPIFSCRPRLELKDLYEKPYLGILVASTGHCLVLHFARHNMQIEKHTKPTFQFDYEALMDSNYATTAPDFSAGNFDCGNQESIEDKFVCDGEADCVNGDDETWSICREKNNCTREQFPCSDGKCIPMNLTCQGPEVSFGHCFARHDESHSGCHKKDCYGSEYRCGDGSCIPDRYVCNEAPDCKEGSDESNCHDRQCDPKGFRCGSGKCLNAVDRCDGYFDCEDGEDEKACGNKDAFLKELGFNKAYGSVASGSFISANTEYAGTKSAFETVRNRMHPHELDRIQLKQGLWIPKHSYIQLPLIPKSPKDSVFLTYGQDFSFCRLLVHHADQTSKRYLGVSKPKCIADQVLESIFSDKLPFDVLVRAAETERFDLNPVNIKNIKDYPDSLANKASILFRNGLIIGGLMDDYEISFICIDLINGGILSPGVSGLKIRSCSTVSANARFLYLFDSQYGIRNSSSNFDTGIVRWANI